MLTLVEAWAMLAFDVSVVLFCSCELMAGIVDMVSVTEVVAVDAWVGAVDALFVDSVDFVVADDVSS